MQNSKAYEYLIKQLNATGSEKKDGYYPRVLEEIYDWERDEVEDIIWNAFNYEKEFELAKFLPKLRKYDGIRKLHRVLVFLEIPSSESVEFASILYNVTGNEKYLNIIDKNIKSSPNEISYVSELSYCKPCKKVYDILKDIYINNNNKVNRNTAVMGILYNKGIVKDIHNIEESNNTIELRKKFKAEDKNERKKILEKFEEDGFIEDDYLQQENLKSNN